MTNKSINEYMRNYVIALKKYNEAKEKVTLNESIRAHQIVDFGFLTFVTVICYTTQSWTMIFPYVVFKLILLAFSQVQSLMLSGNLLTLEKELNSIDEDLINVDRMSKNANNESRI